MEAAGWRELTPPAIRIGTTHNHKGDYDVVSRIEGECIAHDRLVDFQNIYPQR